MSFEPKSELEALIGEYFDTLDAFVAANKNLDSQIKVLTSTEIRKEFPCEQRLHYMNELVVATTHTDLLISGLKLSLMYLETFHTYAKLHVGSVSSQLVHPINPELN